MESKLKKVSLTAQDLAEHTLQLSKIFRAAKLSMVGFGIVADKEFQKSKLKK